MSNKTIMVAVMTAAIAVTGLTVSTSASAQRYYGSYLCGYSEFICIKVKRGDTWEKMFPNPREREIVKRLNRTNMKMTYRSWIVVPKNLRKINEMELSPFPLRRDTHGHKLILVNLNLQAFGAYDANGQLVHWGPVSGGKGYCPDVGRNCTTATGNFRIYRKQGPECKSSKFPIETDGGAPMPYCMHFNGGYALHGSTLPGYHDSHGCVRLFFDDAKWLNQHFITIGTPVIVTRT